MTNKEIVLLHNCMDLQDKRESSSETHPTSHDANEIMSIKVEGVSDTEKEEDDVELRCSGIKTEREVSHMSVSLLGKFQKYPELPVVSVMSISLSAHNKPLFWLMEFEESSECLVFFFINVFTAISHSTHIQIFKIQNLKFLKLSSVVCLYLTHTLHNTYQPIWPSLGALKLLEKLLHFCTLL
jgi:3-hydroxymyristoyl/3-hydroxydecanoyl-(acyl carrier protein) dehydratase